TQDCVLFISLLEIKIRIITRPAYVRRAYFGVVGSAHRFWKTDQLRFFAANRPIVTVTAERNDPLLRVRALEQNMQPAFEPRSRAERATWIALRSLIA